jgi:hypothetical protein
MLGQQVLHAMHTETLALCAGKQHIAITTLRLSQPCLQYGECGFCEGRTAFLAAFADHAHVSADAENDVLAFEPSHFRQAQSRLYRHQEEGMIAPAGPGTLIRSSKQCIDFRSRKKGDQGASEALAGDGEHPLDLC